MNNDASWAEEEFGEADLGDVRRTARLVQLATVLGAQPSASLPAAMPDWADLKAAYRFFDNDCVHAEAVLESHVQATVRRLQVVPLALAVQDTTYLDWTDHTATTGLGPLATPTHQGLLAHTTLALTPEHVPLGLLQQQTWVRDAAVHRHGDHKDRAITEKESEKWLTSLQAVVALQAQCPQTHFVSVGDREADLYELFLVEQPSTVDLLCGPSESQNGPPRTLSVANDGRSTVGGDGPDPGRCPCWAADAQGAVGSPLAGGHVAAPQQTPSQRPTTHVHSVGCLGQ